MRVSIGSPTAQVERPAEFATAVGITEMAATAERSGFDAVWVTDHPFPSVRWLWRAYGVAITRLILSSRCRWPQRRLRHVRLQTHVYILSYRNSFAVAKVMSTLDVVSGGRLTVGIGTGHLKAEFAILGQIYDDRHERTDQGISDIQAAWSGETVAGRQMRPRPSQRPGPPLWIGGNSHRSIRRAVELGDGWAPMPNPRSQSLGARSPVLETPDDLRELLGHATPRRTRKRSVARRRSRMR